jgi:IS4 transposase
VTRIDHYLAHLNQTRPHFPQGLKYLVVDGFYTKQKFVDGVCETGLHMVGKLRTDANLRYLYEGPQNKRGRPRKYDGKVNFNDLSRFSLVAKLEANLTLYSAVVWHVSLKRKLRVACLIDTRKPGKTGRVILFSTDVDLDAQQILAHYQARFQIEFIFRDAKQFTGLSDCQSRDAQKLDFHFNASLMALNVARYETQFQPSDSDPNQKAEPFSMASYKRAAFNDHLLERFISKLDLDPSLIKSHPNYQDLRSYGILAA